MNLQSFQNGQAILAHLERGELDIAFQKAKELLADEPNNPLLQYSLALCYLDKNEENKAMEHFNKTLSLDPSFVSAAENLVELNKDGYSLGELKYLYTLITSHKEGTEEMYRFLDQFSTSSLNDQLSTKKAIRREGGGNGPDDNIYIKHLITQMDKYDKDAPKPDGEACALPTAITPPPHEPPPPPPPPEPKKDEPEIQSTSYGIETLTMAKLYIRQDLHEQAMAILMKLMKRNPDDENIQIEIDNLQILMRERK